MRTFKIILAATGLVCFAAVVLGTLHWPFTADAALIRYATFLRSHGWAPYREIQDYNLPGAYFTDWLVVHTLGSSDLAWRIFDLILLSVAGLSIFLIASPFSRFAGIFGASLFALFHARDGILQTGQRDLTVAVLLVAATAILLQSTKNRNRALFGLLIGSAVTIKPLAILFLPLALLGEAEAPDAPHLNSELWLSRHRKTVKRSLPLLSATVPIVAALLWIASYRALAAFRFTFFHLIPLHAALGYPGTRFLLTRTLTPSLLGLLAMAMIAAFLSQKRDGFRRTRTILIAAMIAGLAFYLGQAKGYPYHRYPLVAFVFLFATLELTQALSQPGPRRAVGIVGLLFAASLAPQYALRALHDRPLTEPTTTLASDLRRIGRQTPLDHEVQCLDTISGCVATLNGLHLEPVTGLIYDEFLFPATATLNPSQQKTVAAVRGPFLAVIRQHPPRALVVSSYLFPQGPGDFAKLANWPEFADRLAACYAPEPTRIFPQSPSEVTRGYRIYLLQPECRDLTRLVR